MARPKLKAEERFEQLISVINSGEPLDLWTYREVVAEYGDKRTSGASTLVALASIAKGDVSEGVTMLEDILPHADVHFARIFCRILERFSLLEKSDYYIYALADKYPTKWLTYKAGGVAYLVGKLSKCADYFDRHNKMLSQEEGREDAEIFRQEVIDDMDSAYKASGCSSEQYMQVALAVHRVMAQFPSAEYRANISGASGGSYIVEVINAPPGQVAEMNMQLADEICSVDLLDDCNLIARFSVERKNAKGSSYAYI
ncbi:hypothetical protein ACU611_03150 [Klebsiella aerogenes]|nr:hypothetical protein [Klebsiella aerogenes]